MGLPKRIDEYAPIEDYAAIGDGVATALVARDGAIDWLCLPRHDSPSVFAAILDPERGGAFTLAPTVPFEATRRYVPRTNVLETVYETDAGTLRVTDALTTQDGNVLPWRELVRRVEGLRGSVPIRWQVAPRFGYGTGRARLERRHEAPVFRAPQCSLAVVAHGAGDIEIEADRVGAEIEIREGAQAVVALVAVDDDGPLPLPERATLETRLGWTITAWRRFVAHHSYGGPWEPAVVRSLLALMLLVDTETGAIVAAPTTSLPERLGGSRNYDYRFSWPRDSSFTLLTLLALGHEQQAHESLAWLLKALTHTHPRVQPVYRLEGGAVSSEAELPLRGYRGSRPVRVGNAAGRQLQLGGYGWLFETAWLYVREGNHLGVESGRRLAATADLVCDLWRRDDAGIWELPERNHHTQSKVWAWLALHRALDLARLGELPARGVIRWRREAGAIRDYVEKHCWSDRLGSYVEHPGAETVDAALLLLLRSPYEEPPSERERATIQVVRERLGEGPLLYRSERLRVEEGAFVACSFWLVEALARSGKLDEAGEAMEKVLALANDVGLYSEQIDPHTGEFLGNFPQGLSHLALIDAALMVDQAYGDASSSELTGERRPRGAASARARSSVPAHARRC